MKNKKILLVLITAVFLLLVGSVYGYFQYNKPHKNVENAEPKLTITAPNLISKFETEKDVISNELLNQIVEISGTVTTVEKSTTGLIVILDSGVKCELKVNDKVIRGQKISIRGIYTGFDEMFNEISFVRCVLVN